VIVNHLWEYDCQHLAVERERLQLHFILLMSAYTASRPGAIVESGHHAHSNRSLTYGKTELSLHRKGNNGRHELVLECTFVFRKGDEGGTKPYVILTQPSCNYHY